MNIDYNKDEKSVDVDIEIKDIIISIALVLLGFIALDESKIAEQNKTLIQLNSEILTELQKQNELLSDSNIDETNKCESE